LPSTRFASVVGFSAGTGTGGSAADAVPQTSSVARRARAAPNRSSRIGRECTLRILAGPAARGRRRPCRLRARQVPAPPAESQRNPRMSREIDKHSALRATDPEIHELIRLETKRQDDFIRLIPSENYASAAVMEATGSILNNKYSEGYPGRRYYEGQDYI